MRVIRKTRAASAFSGFELYKIRFADYTQHMISRPYIFSIAVIATFLVIAHSALAVPITAMTTRETPYYSPDNLEEPEGSLPAFISVSILKSSETDQLLTITFDTASGTKKQALIHKSFIDPAFLATPEPTPTVVVYAEPTPTPSPGPTPTPLPPDTRRITTLQRIPAYDAYAVHRLIGYFPKGVELLVLSNGPPAFSHVLYATESREIRALCRNTDLQTPSQPATPTSTSPSANDSSANEWLKNDEGYKEALSLQRSTRNRVLLYFNASWNNDCEKLSNDLLFTTDFINASKDIIKVSINPEAGKQEAALSGKYDISTLPTILILDTPGGEPRKIKLVKKMYGNVRVLDLPKALSLIRKE